MNLPNPAIDAKFIVEVQGVKEVTLAAEADLGFWQRHLRGAALFPFNNNGKAQLIISGTDFRSMGVHTHELTISLVVCERPAADSPDAVLLIHAFNASRLFAWIERTLFATPYYHGRLRVGDTAPACIQLDDTAGSSFNAQRAATTPPTISRDELWQGKIYLPPKADQYFVAQLSGYTHVYPFSPATDILQLVPRRAHPVFQWLLDSQVTGKAWGIRNNASHARSKTFPRK